MKKYIFGLLLTLILTSCQEKKQAGGEKEHLEHEAPENMVVLNKAQRETLGLNLDTLSKRNLSTVIKLNGQLTIPPSSSANVTVGIGGNVKAINVFEGDKVHKGQVIAWLQHPDYINIQEEFAKTAHQLDYLKQDYLRQKELFENKAVSAKIFQKTKADYLATKAKYAGLKSRLLLLNLSPQKVKAGQISSRIPVLAPINGYVNKINVHIGDYINPDKHLFEIIDNGAVHPDFNVFEKDIFRLKKGQLIHFTVADRSGKEYSAKIFAIGKVLDASSRSIPVHAKMLEKDQSLVPGMFVTGHLHTDNQYVTALPNDAIVKDGDKFYIFVLDTHDDAGHTNDKSGEMHFKMIEVIPGANDENYTEIHLINPIPKGQKIVMNKAYYLLADMNKSETGDDD
jgi:cobalt-zinc-cadmium efflux system membrane fusion protein